MRLGSQLELQTLELNQYLEFGTSLDMHLELRTFGSYWDLELKEMQNPAHQSDKTRSWCKFFFKYTQPIFKR